MTTRTVLLFFVALPLVGFDEPTREGLQRVLAQEDFEEAVAYALEARSVTRRAELLQVLLASARSSSDLVALVDDIDELRNDHERSQLLIAILAHPLVDRSVRLEIIDEIDELDADANRFAVLERMIDVSDPVVVSEMIEAADELDSGHYRYQLMRRMIARHPVERLLDGDLLKEIEDLDQSEFRFELMAQLLRKGDLTRQQHEHLVADASDVIEHQTLLKTFLMEASTRFEPDAQLIHAVGALDSDSYKFEILMPVIEAGAGSDTLTAVLECAEEMNSSGYKLEIVDRAAKIAAHEELITEQVLDALAKIGSEAGSVRVVSTIMAHHPHQEQLAVVLARLPEMLRSEHNIRRMLVMALERAEPNQAVFEMISRLDSDHERAMVLHRVIERKDLDEEQLDMVLRTSMNLSSEHERFKVVRHLVTNHEITPFLEIVFEETLASFDKRHYRKEIEEALYE